MANRKRRATSVDDSRQEGHGRFNLATMSGVFPGTRTQIYQRVQVEELHGQLAGADQQRLRYWLQLLWYDEPQRIVAYRLSPVADTKGVDKDHSKDDSSKEDGIGALFELPFTDSHSLHLQLRTALEEKGCVLRSCGNCAHWRPPATANRDQLLFGSCRWEAEQAIGSVATTLTTALEVPDLLRNQSPFAPACLHWQLAQSDQQRVVVNDEGVSAGTVTPLRRAAEDAEIRQPVGRRLWQRVQHRLGNWLSFGIRDKTDHRRSSSQTWQSALVERSGIGAGTEPCLVCQGRIANLGALTVATVEDDKQTFSIWRCRSCYSLYLNSWVDRWERLDNLETEESYYRLAPYEAGQLLALIDAQQGGEHPSGRHERTAARALFLDFIDGRVPLSHQIRQGR